MQQQPLLYYAHNMLLADCVKLCESMLHQPVTCIQAEVVCELVLGRCRGQEGPS